MNGCIYGALCLSHNILSRFKNPKHGWAVGARLTAPAWLSEVRYLCYDIRKQYIVIVLEPQMLYDVG